MSVDTPTEGKLGLVREKRGDREVGIIAIAYPRFTLGGWEGKEIWVAITISASSRFQWESWIT